MWDDPVWLGLGDVFMDQTDGQELGVTEVPSEVLERVAGRAAACTATEGGAVASSAAAGGATASTAAIGGTVVSTAASHGAASLSAAGGGGAAFWTASAAVAPAVRCEPQTTFLVLVHIDDYEVYMERLLLQAEKGGIFYAAPTTALTKIVQSDFKAMIASLKDFAGARSCERRGWRFSLLTIVSGTPALDIPTLQTDKLQQTLVVPMAFAAENAAEVVADVVVRDGGSFPMAGMKPQVLDMLDKAPARAALPEYGFLPRLLGKLSVAILRQMKRTYKANNDRGVVPETAAVEALSPQLVDCTSDLVRLGEMNKEGSRRHWSSSVSTCSSVKARMNIFQPSSNINLTELVPGVRGAPATLALGVRLFLRADICEERYQSTPIMANHFPQIMSVEASLHGPNI